MVSVNNEIKRFSHSVGQNWYHIVLVVKKRGKAFAWEKPREVAKEGFVWICKRHNFDLYTLEVMDDHVHLFLSCPPECSIRQMFKIIKGGSSYYIRKNYPALKKFDSLWNRGTMYRSIGSVSAETVKHYIEKSNSWMHTKQTTL